MTERQLYTDRTEHDVTVILTEGGAVAGDAVIAPHGDAVDIRICVASGHWPMAMREALLDAVFGVHDVQRSSEFSAAIPLGDVQLLEGLSARCVCLHTRAAGSTCLLEGRLISHADDGQPADAQPDSAQSHDAQPQDAVSNDGAA
jgi:hypothetical protein